MSTLYGRRRVFATGVGIRLVGLAFIALANGHDNLAAKALVVLGVLVSVLGMGVLRYLLFGPLLRRLGRRDRPAVAVRRPWPLSQPPNQRPSAR